MSGKGLSQSQLASTGQTLLSHLSLLSGVARKICHLIALELNTWHLLCQTIFLKAAEGAKAAAEAAAVRLQAAAEASAKAEAQAVALADQRQVCVPVILTNVVQRLSYIHYKHHRLPTLSACCTCKASPASL